MSDRPLYLDNCATTRIDPQVLATMVRYFEHDYGNSASTSHRYGWDAQTAVEEATRRVAKSIGAKESEIYFTSGATESNNLAILGWMRSAANQGKHLITCVTEHKSVLDTCQALEESGHSVTYLRVDSNGALNLNDLAAAIRPGETAMVSVMWFNNETGVAHPIAEIAELCRRQGIALHVDATQAVGKIPVDVKFQGIDFLSFSGHKLHGPKGVGVLYVRRELRAQVAPQIHGGRHQRGLRSGTLPVPLIAGLGVACELAATRLDSEMVQVQGLRDDLERRITQALPGVVVHGGGQIRNPIVTNLGFPGLDGEALLVAMDRVAVSAGSACTSATGQPSYVLLAMGVDSQLAKSSLRISLSHETTRDDVTWAAEFIIDTVRRLQATESSRAVAVDSVP